MTRSIRYLFGAIGLVSVFCIIGVTVEINVVDVQAQTSVPNSNVPPNPINLTQKLESSAVDLITPISNTSGNFLAPPIIGNMNSAKTASVRLLVSVANLGQNTRFLTLDKVNNAFAAYNNLVVVMGLTDARQLAYYPRLKAISESLVQLKTQISGN